MRKIATPRARSIIVVHLRNAPVSIYVQHDDALTWSATLSERSLELAATPLHLIALGSEVQRIGQLAAYLQSRSDAVPAVTPSV